MPAGKLFQVKRDDRKLSKKVTKEVKQIAQKVFNKNTETKTFGFNKENIELIHNLTDYRTKWLACKQGTADPNNQSAYLCRIGDEINLTNINVRLWLSNKKDRPNVMYKAALFWYDADATVDNAAVYFTQTNKMLDRYNNESITIIDQQILFSTNNYASTENEKSYLMTLGKRYKNRKITYDEGGTQPKKRDIGLVVVCYDAYGTLQADNIASYAYNGIIQYKDA